MLGYRRDSDAARPSDDAIAFTRVHRADRRFFCSPTTPMTTADWDVVIGLNRYTQLATASKIFSPAATAFGGERTRTRA